MNKHPLYYPPTPEGTAIKLEALSDRMAIYERLHAKSHEDLTNAIKALDKKVDRDGQQKLFAAVALLMCSFAALIGVVMYIATAVIDKSGIL